jgi:hypothetical protein
VAGVLPLEQRRELAVIASRQVLANGADLGLDDVEVIEKPLGGRRNELAPALSRSRGFSRFERCSGLATVNLAASDFARSSSRSTLSSSSRSGFSGGVGVRRNGRNRNDTLFRQGNAGGVPDGLSSSPTPSGRYLPFMRNVRLLCGELS